MNLWRNFCIVSFVLISSGLFENEAQVQVTFKQGLSQLLYAVKPKTTVNYGTTAQISFLSNFSATPFKFMSFFMDVNGDTIATGASDSINPEKSSKAFGNRLVTVKVNNNEYRLFISEANYEDNVIIQANVLLNEGSSTQPDVTIVRSNTTLEVVGGPAFCRDSMTGPPIGELLAETDVYVNISQPTFIETMICGNPKPLVTWKLGDETLTETTSELVVKDQTQGTRYKGRYRFRVKLPMVTPSMCGKHLKFTSTGNSGVRWNGQTKLNVKFTPSTVIRTSYRINSSCVHVEWEPLEIGLCSGLQYEIRFSNNTGFPISTSISPHPNTSHVSCFGDVIVENSTHVQAQVHFDGVVGGWSGSKVVLLENPAPKPIIDTGKSTQSDGIHEDWEAIVGGVVGGFFLLLLIILVIYCCCCGCCAGWCAGCCICSACCEKEKKEEKYGVENSNSLSFQYKKNSKKKTRNVKVDLKNDTYSNSDMSNTFAPVVLAGEKPEKAKSTTIYAHVQKPDSNPSTLPKSEESKDMQYFDPSEFDVESEQPPTTLKSTYTNSTYDYGEDDDIDNKPSFLI